MKNLGRDVSGAEVKRAFFQIEWRYVTFVPASPNSYHRPGRPRKLLHLKMTQFADLFPLSALLVILFIGPLFEAAVAEGRWRDWLRLRGLWQTLSSPMGLRNYVMVSFLLLLNLQKIRDF